MFFKIDDGQNHLLRYRIDDQIANIVQAQLLFLESADASRYSDLFEFSWRKCLCRIRDL
jgi:hypothetical protein